MEIYVLNKNFEVVDILENYESCIWTTRFRKAGDFEIYMQASERAINTLRENYYLMRYDNATVMIIKDIGITTDIENGNYLTVTGVSLESILAQRIVWEQTILKSKIGTAIRKLLNENVVQPEIQERKIDNFNIGEIDVTNKSIEMQTTGDNLEKVIQEICVVDKLGYAVTLEEDKFMFTLKRGKDRTYNQNENDIVIFSPDFDNLENTEYQYKSSNYKNVALVAGEGEGKARKTAVVGVAVGIDRYELYVDARNDSSNNGEITEDEYEQQLKGKGEEKLGECKKTESFTGETLDYNFKFNVDYSLGDIVEVENEYGMTAQAQITEIIESDDENGYSIIPTFEYQE